MKNLIRKILKESEFDWAEETPEFNPLEEPWIIIYDNDMEFIELQNWLFSNNISWVYLDEDEDEDVRWELLRGGRRGGFLFSGGLVGDVDQVVGGSLEVFDGYSMGMLDRPMWGNRKKYKWSELKKQGLNESEFNWVEEIPSFSLPKDKHWFILIDNNDELRQAEEFIRNWYNYSNDGPMFYDEDGRGGGLRALEHNPEEEGRTADWLYDGRFAPYYDGRFAPHDHYYTEYPNALIYKWSDIQKEI